MSFLCPINDCVCRCDKENGDYCHYSEELANKQKAEEAASLDKCDVMKDKKAVFLDELCDLLEKHNVDIRAEIHSETAQVVIEFNELAEAVFTTILDVNFCVLECKDIDQENT